MMMMISSKQGKEAIGRILPLAAIRALKYAVMLILLQTCSCLSMVVSPSGGSSSSNVKVGRVRTGGSALEISEIGIGTWQWGNRLLYNYNPKQDEELYEAYRVVRDAGVTLFDTADSYGTMELNGRAETLLGLFEQKYLQEKLQVSSLGEEAQVSGNKLSSILEQYFGSSKQKVRKNTAILPQQVATKLAPYPWRITSQSIVDATKASLARLGQDKLALAQLHWSASNYFPFQERALWEGIADTYDQGLCEAVGVSNFGPKQLNKFALRMEARQVPLATAQIQYSLLTYKDPSTRDMVDACRDLNNVRLIAYSPLGLGLLTGKYSVQRNILPPMGNPRRQLFIELLPGAQPLLNLLEVIAAETGKTQSQVAINWALCKGAVPIPGGRTVQQATENIGAVGWRLSSGTVDELDRTALVISKPMIQNIFQTK